MDEEDREQERLRLERKRVKDQRRMEREERRRMRKKKKKFATEEEEMDARIATEERKLLVAARKLESIRLLDELLERVKVIPLVCGLSAGVGVTNNGHFGVPIHGLGCDSLLLAASYG